MFDALTASRIREAPQLKGLDKERLPEEFTKAFAEIVAFRVRFGRNPSHLQSELKQELSRFHRMAVTFEGMVTLSPSRSNSRQAAFVAAHAYHLLHVVKEAFGESAPEKLLTATTVSPSVTSLILFLVADQPPDAAEMARRLESTTAFGSSNAALLVRALRALALGQIQLIEGFAFNDELFGEHDAVEAAADALYGHIGSALKIFSQHFKTDSHERNELSSAIKKLEEVRTLSQGGLSPDELKMFGGYPILVFPGPHHLATLLITAISHLSKLSLLHLEVPEEVHRRAWLELLVPIADERPYLWPNHLEAIKSGLLKPGTSAAISFPTGAGKTTLSSLKIASCLATGHSCIYLAPTNALVSQVKRDLTSGFPNVSVMESLVSEDFYVEAEDTFLSSKAHITVMTPERCLAVLSVDSQSLANLGLVVFDECHLIHPGQGGRTRRNVDAMLAVLHLRQSAPQADWIMLSAMMANAEEIADWIQGITGRTCLSLTLNWKPTRQARGCVVYDMERLLSIKHDLRAASITAVRVSKKLPLPTKAVKKMVTAVPSIFMGLQQTWQDRLVENYALLQLMNEPIELGVGKGASEWYPTANKNAVAASIAMKCAEIGLTVLAFAQSQVHVGSIAKQINELSSSSKPIELSSDERDFLRVAIEEIGSLDAVVRPHGVAGQHHALLLPFEREIVERVFRRKGSGLRVLTATPTLAQGINLPADVVLIVGDQRFDDETEGFAPLDAHELLNAAGRAGRAGLVAQGVVIVIPHNLVGFNPKTQQIGNDWARLQTTVFSKADQCLELADPLGRLLDKLQHETNVDTSELKYFLRRIPRSDDESSEETRRFLRSSLVGWQAKRAAKEKEFENKVDVVILRQKETDAGEETQKPLQELAYRTGISKDLIVKLHYAVTSLQDDQPINVEGWIRWFFRWLAAEPGAVDELFAHRIPEKQREELNNADFFGGRLAEAVVSWIHAQPLLELEPLLVGKATKHGECKQARRFVLRLLPDLAFAAGLITLVQRTNVETNGGKMSTVLAVLGLCIREGAASPELAALRAAASSANYRLSRKGVGALWERVGKYVQAASSPYESFLQTRRRVQAGFDIFNAQT